ncbi:MAG TPA: Ig-like domain repeat protein, partial [Terracidiphilus sp.]
SLWYLTNQFVYSSGSGASFAVDGSDNLYNFYNWGTTTCYIQEESLYQAEYSPVAKRVAGGSACGFSGDGGQARSAEISNKLGQIAFDVAGNLYFADAGNQRIRRIDAATGIISTIAGSGTAGYSGDAGAATLATLSNPTGVAVDSQGQVYILSNVPTAGPTQVVRKVGNFGFWYFAPQLKGSTSAAKVFTVANTGNSVMTLSANAFFAGNNPTEFAIDPATTSCALTAGATLAAGRSCNIGVFFKPAAAGNRGAQLVIPTNTITGTNSIHLGGTGTLPAPTMTITSPTGGSSVKTGVTVTFAVSVTSTATTKPTGTVTFKANSATIGSPVTLSSTGTASTVFSEPSAASYTLSAVYSGDANYATATVTESLVVTTVAAPVKVNLTPAATPLSACSPASFTVQVSSSSGQPTGTVQLKSGASVLGSKSLTNGAASLTAGAMAAGSHTFTANYSGDSLHPPATSAPVTLTVPAATASCTGGNPPSVGGVSSPHRISLR